MPITAIKISQLRRRAGPGSYSVASISPIKPLLLESPFKKQRREYKHGQGEQAKIHDIGPDGGNAHALEQHRLEAVHGIGEGIDPGDPLQPFGEGLHWINGAAGKIEE